MNTPEVKCSACGDMMDMNLARIAEDSEFETDLADVRYLCPVCAIQAKNAIMQTQMQRALSTKY